MLKCAQSADVATDTEEEYDSDEQVNELEGWLLMHCGCHSAFGCDEDGDI
jgi:hypothetical protein